MMLPYSLYDIFAFFFIYSFLGWCVEVIFCTIVTGKLVNRGFLNGPVCPIYGFGMVGILCLLHPVLNNMAALFLGATLLTTSIELIGGWVLFKLFHARWWDYSHYRFNLGGFICLQFSLTWGLATLAVIKLLNPIVEAFIGLFPPLVGCIMMVVFAAVMAFDLISSVAVAHGLDQKLHQLSTIDVELRQYSDSLSSLLGNFALSADERVDETQLQMKLAAAEAKDTANAKLSSARTDAARRVAALTQQRTAILDKLQEGKLWGTARLMNAFPEMQHSTYQAALDKARASLKTRAEKSNRQK